MSFCAQVTSKTIVSIFSFIVFVLGVIVLAMGILGLNYLDSTWLADALPSASSIAMVCLGSALLIISLGSLFGVLCCLKQSKICLLVLGLFTFVLTVLSAITCAVSFNYTAVMSAAAANGFAGANGTISGTETDIYRSLLNAYVRAYTECNATAYFTPRVQAQCELAENTTGLSVASCASETYGGGEPGYVGMYCRNGPAMEPFSVDSALAFPDTNTNLGNALGTIQRARTFGFFLDAVCMPNSTRYAQLLGNTLIAELTGAAQDSAFGRCYTADWWADDLSGLSTSEQAQATAAPSRPGAFDRKPDGSALSPEQAAFFATLQSGPIASLLNPLLSAKLSFCFCADSGSHSRLFELLTDLTNNIKYVSLALAIAFGITFLAEVYLGCCAPVDKKDDQKHLNPEGVHVVQAQPQRGYVAGSQAGGGLVAR